jgi:hypothetical protein
MKALLVSTASFVVTPPCRLRDMRSNEECTRRMHLQTAPVKTASETGHSNGGGEKHDI